MEAQAVSRLVGPPPGYVGYEEGGQLTDAVRRTPYTVVLLDEMEKAHADVFNVLLQVLEDGRLTDSKGRTVDFTNTVIVMTSNVGSGAILETVRAAADGSSSEEEVYAATATAVREELLSRYRPEFLNRMDEIITFRPLVEDELQSIASIMLAGVAQRVQAACGSTLEVGPALRARICSEGFSPSFGARPLRRAVQRLVEDVAAEALLSGMGGAQDDVILFECGSAAGGDTSMVVASCGSKERLEVRVQADSTGIEAMGTDGTAAAQAADARSEFQAAMSDAAAALGMPEPGSAFN